MIYGDYIFMLHVTIIDLVRYTSSISKKKSTLRINLSYIILSLTSFITKE